MNGFFNEFFLNFHFLRPWLLLLLLVPATFYFVLFKNDANLSSWEKVCDKKLLDFLLIKGDNGRRKFSVFLIYAGLIFSVIAAAGPTWQKEEQALLLNNKPVMILLNLSTDMQQSDLSPNRLTRAKMEIKTLLEQKGVADAESGLIVYTAEPFMISPLSDDAGLITNLLPAINFDIMPLNGDRPDRAINMAAEKIKAAGYNHGDIILFAAAAGTDFSAALESAEKAAAAGIRVNTVNVSAKSSTGLTRLAAAGQGVASTFADIGKIMQRLNNQDLGNKKESDNMSESWRDFGYYLLFVPLLCCLYFFRRGLWLVVLTTIIATPASAGFFFNDNQEAMKLYEQGQYAKAAEQFKHEQWKASSWYRAGDYVRAADSFSKVKDIESLYNYGNALAKSGDSEKAFSYLDKAVQYNADITGKAHLVRAQILATSKNFSEAITYCNKAAQEDVSISGSANRLKEKIQEVQRKNAEYERQNAAYQAEKARREKEENFWKAGAQ